MKMSDRISKTKAEEFAEKQREISVAEFFEKNRHLLGFDNPIKALLTTVKEAVDNSLDACEEADILPEIIVHITKLDRTKFKVCVEDNGPGIVREQIGPIFGKLLYGSKFVTFGGKQSRGQQGIGISAAVLYAQLTTGKPATIISKISPDKPALKVQLKIDVKKNEPKIISEEKITWPKDHGTKIELELEAKYVEKRASVLEYIKQTAVVNPHAKIIYIDPNGQKLTFPRVTEQLPKKPKFIKPHPYGVELGLLERMLKTTSARTLKSFLVNEFDKVGSGTADEILKVAELDPKIMPKLLTLDQTEKLLKAMQSVKIMAPSTDCLSPIGADILEKSLRAEYDLEFACAITRSPTVYRGNPFQIEVAIGYGGELPKDQPVKLIRFANRVPLLYQQSSCAITKAVMSVDWKKYGLQQSANSLPVGPAIILVHMASVWAPFTSESKEAIANYPEIIKEIRLALQEAGRKLQVFVGRKLRHQLAQKKKEIFKAYSQELAASLAELTGLEKQKIYQQLVKIAESMYWTIEEIERPSRGTRRIGGFKTIEELEEVTDEGER